MKRIGLVLIKIKAYWSKKRLQSYMVAASFSTINPLPFYGATGLIIILSYYSSTMSIFIVTY